MHRGRHPCQAPPIVSCASLCRSLASLHRVSAYVFVLPTTLDCELLENVCCQLPILTCSLSQAEFGLEQRGEGYFLLTPTKISQKPNALKGGFTSSCPAKPGSVRGPRKPETPLYPDHPPTPPAPAPRPQLRRLTKWSPSSQRWNPPLFSHPSPHLPICPGPHSFPSHLVRTPEMSSTPPEWVPLTWSLLSAGLQFISIFTLSPLRNPVREANIDPTLQMEKLRLCKLKHREGE